MDRGTLTAMHDAITNKTFAQCWTLDATGNWNGFREDDDGDGTWDLNQSRTANTVNEITGISETTGPTSVTPVYDAAGNMTTMPSVADPTVSQTCIYDAWNRLVEVDDGDDPLSRYHYDAAKRRVIQESYTSGTLSETRHLYYTEPSMWQVIEERVGTSPDSADAERQFAWGLRYIDDLIVRDRDTDSHGTLDERLFAATDANWNVTASVTSSGIIRERYIYSTYGMPSFLSAAFAPQLASSCDWETLYSSYRWDATSELFHVKHRVYHYTVGAWLQRDPFKLHSLVNVYSYALSRPLISTDPAGLSPSFSPFPGSEQHHWWPDTKKIKDFIAGCTKPTDLAKWFDRDMFTTPVDPKVHGWDIHHKDNLNYNAKVEELIDETGNDCCAFMCKMIGVVKRAAAEFTTTHKFVTYKYNELTDTTLLLDQVCERACRPPQPHCPLGPVTVPVPVPVAPTSNVMTYIIIGGILVLVFTPWPDELLLIPLLGTL